MYIMTRFIRVMPKSIMNYSYKTPSIVRERINLQDIKHIITTHNEKTVYLAAVSKDGSAANLAFATHDEELVSKLLDEYAITIL